MKWICIAFLFATVLIKDASGQTAKLNVKVTNPKFSGLVKIWDPSARYEDLQNVDTPIGLDSKQSGSITIDVPDVKFVNLLVYGPLGGAPFGYKLFLSPGDDLSITLKFNNDKSNVAITGRGYLCNQRQ